MNSTAAAWISLIVAGIFEFVWAVGMKYSEGFTRLMPSIVCVLGMIGSFVFLIYAVKHIPLGTAYTVWVGIGVVSITLYSILWFNEPATPARLFCIFLILTGAVGLKLIGANET